MQTWRTTLILISLAIVFLATGCLNPLKEEASSAPFAIAQQGVVDLNQTDQPPPPIADPKTDFENEEFVRVSEVLNTTATGKKMLSLIEQYDIDVRFESDGGSRFNPNSNQIVVDSNTELYAAALILIHEVTHARYLHEDSAADVKADGREEFVHKKVTEEMEAVVGSIEAKMELEGVGFNTSELPCTLEYPYRQAYWAATSAAIAGDPGLDDETLQTISRAAGRASVLQSLLNGKAVTSNTRQTYPFYWGAEWDKQNDSS